MREGGARKTRLHAKGGNEREKKNGQEKNSSVINNTFLFGFDLSLSRTTAIRIDRR